MILNKVSIKNYRQYRDIEIEFAKGSRNFTIIQGNNGTGKTTLLNALSWCLYDTEIHDYGDDSAMNICNNKSANLANINDVINVEVYLEFLDEGNILSFKRSTGFRKTEYDLIPAMNSSNFVVTMEKDHNTEVRNDNHYIVERKIPKEVEDYFFFDGARLSEYFQSHKNTQIRDAVFSLSQLNWLENVSNNLINVKGNLIKKQKKIEPKLGKVSQKIENYESKIENTQKSLDEANKLINEIDDELNNISNLLLSKNSSSVTKDAERSKELDELIEDNNEKLRNAKKEYKDHILTNYPYVLTYEYFINLLNLGEESREKGFIPPKYKKSFIRDLLEEGKCICGNDVSFDNEFRQELERLLEVTNPLTDNSEEITVALNYIKEVIIKKIKSFKSKSHELHNSITQFEKNKKNFIDEKREISARLDSNPVEEIRKLNHTKKILENEKDKNLKIIGSAEPEIDRLSKLLGEQRKLLSEELRLSKKSDDYTKKINFCSEKSIAAKDIYSSFKEDMRVKIQTLTKEKFIKIQWKEEEFVDIRIDSDYNVFIKNKLGDEERPGDLSDGEKLCLGLCFMSALHSVSGFDLPIIMDTPLGNLDTDMRHNIAKFLPKFVGDKQTVLLVTGTEYTDDFRDTIYPAVGKEYIIKWENSEKGKESKVVENEE